MLPPFRVLLIAAVDLCFAFPPTLFAQATIATGNIQGVISDRSGSVILGAKISISNKSTGQTFTIATNSAGNYNSGALIPGSYLLHVEAPGFQTTEFLANVQVGVTSSGNLTMQIGEVKAAVRVEGSELSVNTQQAMVQGVLTGQQIDTLPINGRNFLELAQLEPGVQIMEGGNFDPSKNGFSS